MSDHNNTSAFLDYLRLLKNGDLTMESKKAYIIFTTCRLGTDAVDTMYVNMVDKTIYGNVDYHGGMPDARINSAVGSGRGNYSKKTENGKEEIEQL